jgi:hypothetical protein
MLCQFLRARAELASNLALGSCLPAMWRPYQKGHALQGTGDGLGSVHNVGCQAASGSWLTVSGVSIANWFIASFQ